MPIRRGSSSQPSTLASCSARWPWSSWIRCTFTTHILTGEATSVATQHLPLGFPLPSSSRFPLDARNTRGSALRLGAVSVTLTARVFQSVALPLRPSWVGMTAMRFCGLRLP